MTASEDRYREHAPDKARRYLADGRLTVTHVSDHRIDARCRGDTGVWAVRVDPTGRLVVRLSVPTPLLAPDRSAAGHRHACSGGSYHAASQQPARLKR